MRERNLEYVYLSLCLSVCVCVFCSTYITWQSCFQHARTQAHTHAATHQLSTPPHTNPPPLHNYTRMHIYTHRYTIRNVARCWAYETALTLDEQLRNELPYNDYYEYFAPDHQLHISPSNMENLNQADYLQKIKERIFENLRHVPAAPGLCVNVMYVCDVCHMHRDMHSLIR